MVNILDLKNQFFVLIIFFVSNSFSQDDKIKMEQDSVIPQYLNEVTVSKKIQSIEKSIFSASNTTTVSSDELLKAACCNLSESFETNPAIDVNYSDGLTGNKQIELLGLKSPYILFTMENIPAFRGSNQNFGLSFVPGTWVESIQISKGSGTVTNGYESISGQINTELIKPQTAPSLFFNLFRSLNGRNEINLQGSKKVNDNFSSSLFLHANNRTQKNDKNKDGFLDSPIAKQINLLNRWQYLNSKKGIIGFASFRFLTDKKDIGQLNFNPNNHKFSESIWGGEIDTEKFDFSIKTGYVNPKIPYRSFGFQSSINYHSQDSYFGQNEYKINYTSYFNHVVYQSIIGNTLNKFKAGLQYMYDSYDEQILDYSIKRDEKNLGLFFEYSYDSFSNFNFIVGGRVDFHNSIGTFFTPRVHLRHAFFDNKTILRLSAGEGRRISSIFIENQKFLMSKRSLIIESISSPLYGMKPEKAWNYGFSLVQKVYLSNQLIDLGVDFYRTEFSNRVVVDWENPGEISFYNLEGNSFSQNIYFSANSSFKNIDLRFSYKMYDVQTEYKSGLKKVPLQPKNGWFAFVGYSSKIANEKQWRGDFTLHNKGSQRLVKNFTEESRYIQDFMLVNSQITRQFSEKFSAYIGAENITDFKQKNAILGAENPFNYDFDASQIYAPVFGRMIYAGLRLNL